jgi:Tol biopolymer transport system component
MTDPHSPGLSPLEVPLESWKAIAAYLQRDIRTAKRWEASERLPVHRHLHQARSSVYAFPSELDGWRQARQPQADGSYAGFGPRTRLLALAAMVVWALGNQADWRSHAGAYSSDGAAGLTLRQVWAGTDVDTSGRVSPDGRYLSFTDWETGDLAVRTIATGENRRVTNKGPWSLSGEMALGSVFSPDGARIAYGWMVRSGLVELRVIGSDGSGRRMLYQNPDVVYSEPKAWSPDGASVLVTFLRKNQTTQLVLVSASDGSARVLKTLDWRWPATASFSPDGRYIAYDFRSRENAPQRDILLIELDGNRETLLVQHAADDGLLGWRPDGRAILMLSDRSGSADGWMLKVADGRVQGPPELVKRDLGRVEPLGTTSDGSLYYGLPTGGSDIYVAELDQGSGTIVSAPRQVSERYVGSNRYPVWSPDGRFLAYVSERGRRSTPGSRTVVVHPLQGGEDRDIQLTNLMSFRLYGGCGKAGAVVGVGVHRNKSDVYRLDLAAGDVRQIAPGEVGMGLGVPACAPDESCTFSEAAPDGSPGSFRGRSQPTGSGSCTSSCSTVDGRPTWPYPLTGDRWRCR